MVLLAAAILFTAPLYLKNHDVNPSKIAKSSKSSASASDMPRIPDEIPDFDTSLQNKANQHTSYEDLLDSLYENDTIYRNYRDSIYRDRNLADGGGGGSGGGGSSEGSYNASDEINIPTIILWIALISLPIVAIWRKLKNLKHEHKKLDTAKIVSEISLKLNEKLPLK